jgi:hypothetical protein
MRSKRLLLSLALALVLIAGAAKNVFADCTDPDRPEGSIVYNTDYNVHQYCNGIEWVAFGALNPAAGGSGCADPVASEGKLAYNSTYHVLQYCDGDDWRTVGSGEISGGHGFLGFTDLSDQSRSALLTSNILQVALADSPASVSISGDGSPQYRICSDAACTAEVQAWGSAAGSVSNGEFLQLRLTSDASFGVTRSATVAVGVSNDQWDVSTAGQDTTPDSFSFTDQTNVAQSTVISSNIVNIIGINDTADVTIGGDGSPQFRIDGGTWTSGPATITNGQTLQLRLTSGGFSETRLATVTVGTFDEEWSVSTSSQDTSPDAFNFTDTTGTALNTLTTSNSVNITGITGSVNVSVSGAGSPQVRVNGGSWTAGPTTITNGQSLEVRLTSSSSPNTMRSATVTVGSGSNQWDVTTVKSFVTALTDLGLTTNLVLALDAGDSNSYSGAGQQWSDVSGQGNSFNRGLTSSAESEDPAFNGSAGMLSASEYFLFDHASPADRMSSVSTTTFDDSWHKNNAALTLALAIYIPSSGASTLRRLGTNYTTPTGNPGFFFEIDTSNQLKVASWNGSADSSDYWGNVNSIDDNWAIIIVSINEAGGAGASHWNVNGAISTFNASYTSPSSTNPPINWVIGAGLYSGTRLGAYFAWNRTLSQAETASVFSVMRTRYGL